MKRLLFVRHGQTDLNVAMRFAGHLPAMLTDAGKLQAIEAGRRTKESVPVVDLIVTSTFQRAIDTAKLIAKELEYPEERIEESDLFIERNFGSLEGTLTEDFFREHTYADTDEAEGAETVEQLQARAELGLAWLKKRDEDIILLVGHGAYGRALRRVIAGRPYTDEFEGLKFIDNAEILKLI